MKINKFPNFQKTLEDLKMFVFLWIFGIGIFASLIMLTKTNLGWTIGWIDALSITVIPAFIWAVFNTVSDSIDDKKKAKIESRQIIKDAVIESLENKKYYDIEQNNNCIS